MTIFYIEQSLNFSTIVNNVVEKQTYVSKMCNTFSQKGHSYFLKRKHFHHVFLGNITNCLACLQGHFSVFFILIYFYKDHHSLLCK